MDNELPAGWRALALEECMSAIIDYRGKSPEKTERGVPLITAKVVKGGRILDQEHEYIASEDYEAWMRRGLPEIGDILLTTEAPLGEVAQVQDARIALAQRLILLRGRPGLLDNTFLKFALQSTTVQRELHSRSTGTTVLGIRQSELRRVLLPIPPIDEQIAIAEILGSLDDKIDLNRRMNQTLEAMTQALFRSWFVDFGPVRAKVDGRQSEGMDSETAALFPSRFVNSKLGDIPEGWSTQTVEEVAAVNARTLASSDRLPQLEYIEISGVRRGDVLEKSIYKRGEEPSRARRRIRHGDTVISTVRPERGAFFLALQPAEHLVVSTGFVVLSPRNVPWAWLHAALTRDEVFAHLGHIADGGAYPAVRPETVAALALVTAPAPLLDRYQQLVEPMFLRMETNRRESLNLANLRDMLLPKLISGEMKVNMAPQSIGHGE